MSWKNNMCHVAHINQKPSWLTWRQIKMHISLPDLYFLNASLCCISDPAGLFSHSDPSWIGTNILHPPSQSDLA